MCFFSGQESRSRRRPPRPAVPDVITFQCERRFVFVEGAQMKPPCYQKKKEKVCFGFVRYDGHIEGGGMSKQESNFGLTCCLFNNNKKKRKISKRHLISPPRKTWPSFKSNCDADSLITIIPNIFNGILRDKSNQLWHNQVITIPPMSIRYDRNFSLFWWFKKEEVGR